MHFAIVTLFPEFVASAMRVGVVGKAVTRELLGFDAWNPRDFTDDVHRTVDDRPYGGGPGMVMKPEPLSAAIRAARASGNDLKTTKVVYLSPQGQPLTQNKVRELTTIDQLVLVCGRYEGIDERVVQTEIDEEISIGDYVLSGGELPALVLIDAIARQIPGVLGHELSAEQDSFQHGLLDCPHYTRPEKFEGQAVPAVLLSGDHGAIEKWRAEQSQSRTQQRRPDLLVKSFE